MELPTRGLFGLCLLATFCLHPPAVASQGNSELQQLIDQKEAIVAKLAEASAEAWANRKQLVKNCTCAHHRCSNVQGPDTKCTRRLPTPPLCKDCTGVMVDYNKVSLDVAPGSDPANLTEGVVESICAYRSLESLMIDLKPSSWLYTSSVDGTFIRYPYRTRERKTDGTGERHFEQCQSYDPRVRPWYVAASTGPKDVVILLDISESIGRPNHMPRLTLAKNALRKLLRTFSPSDYVNIVTFGHEATQLWNETFLMKATEKNIEKLEGKVNGLTEGGGTDFNVGFELAFKLISDAAQANGKDEAHSSGCTRHIILLTDGKDCSRKGGLHCSLSHDKDGPEKVLQNIEARQSQLEELVGSRAFIFTFSMGAEAEDSLPRQIACANQGTWAFIEEGDDPLERMRSYHTYLAARRHGANPVWAQPYIDTDNITLITTVSKPFYAPDGRNGVKGPMIGISAYDVHLDELETAEMTKEEMIDWLVQASTGCYDLELDVCQLQYQRGFNSDNSACPDKLPWKRCYQYDDAWFMYFKQRLDWDGAKEHCQSYGGNLASVRNMRHLSLLASLSNPRGSWLGAVRVPFCPTDCFRWQNRDLDHLHRDSQYWALPGPLDRGKECAFIDPRGESRNMAAAVCTDKLSFICEFTEEVPRVCWNSVEVIDPETFYEIPSLSNCREGDWPTGETDSPSNQPSSQKAICDLGSTKPYIELACCADC